jgi:hypothetical protein
MYIRWNVRQRAHTVTPWREDTVTRSAALVQSVRVEGKPRQRIVAWLGSVNEGRLLRAKGWEDEAPRRWFWRRARPRLADLVAQGVLTPEQEATFTVQLAAVVPPLTDAEERAADERRQAAMAQIAMLRAMRG